MRSEGARRQTAGVGNDRFNGGRGHDAGDVLGREPDLPTDNVVRYLAPTGTSSPPVFRVAPGLCDLCDGEEARECSVRGSLVIPPSCGGCAARARALPASTLSPSYVLLALALLAALASGPFDGLDDVGPTVGTRLRRAGSAGSPTALIGFSVDPLTFGDRARWAAQEGSAETGVLLDVRPAARARGHRRLHGASARSVPPVLCSALGPPAGFAADGHAAGACAREPDPAVTADACRSTRVVLGESIDAYRDRCGRGLRRRA